MKTGIKRISRFEHIGTIMEGVLADFQKSFNYHLLAIQAVWSDVVGPSAAQNTKPAGIKEKILFVNVASSSWMHELQFLKEEIIQGINGKLGAERVEEIRFKIGPT